MKKLTALIIITLTVTLALILAACGGGSSGGTYTGEIPDIVHGQESAAVPVPTPAPTPAPDGDGAPAATTPDQSQDPSPPSASTTIGDTMEFGGYEWRVLEVSDGKALLLSEYIIEGRDYHNERFVEITWADCDLRAYLNGEFLDSFSADDKAKIVLTSNSNQDNPWFSISGGDDTDDYIFLLSIEEVVQYFGDSGQLANQPEGKVSIDDEYNEARIAYSQDGSDFGWWLRTVGAIREQAVFVYNGEIEVAGSTFGRGDSNYGVRPAMWVNLE